MAPRDKLPRRLLALRCRGPILRFFDLANYASYTAPKRTKSLAIRMPKKGQNLNLSPPLPLRGCWSCRDRARERVGAPTSATAQTFFAGMHVTHAPPMRCCTLTRAVCFGEHMHSSNPLAARGPGRRACSVQYGFDPERRAVWLCKRAYGSAPGGWSIAVRVHTA